MIYMPNLDLQHIPKSPGIYKYFNKEGTIIYIGKSVNLFSRVNSYFNGKSKLNFAKKKMVEQIVRIETIITTNETESLILETTLIKQHKPKYNILMKDDKNHLYIKITDTTFPKILKTRIKTKSGVYFGPYISTFHVNNILKIIKKHFGYGCHDIHFFKEGGGYNLDKYLFKNNGIISRPHTSSTPFNNDGGEKIEDTVINEYNQQIKNIKKFLKGNFQDVISSIEEKMKSHAKELNFEEAQKAKEQIESIKSLEINQNVRDAVQGDYNVIHYLEKFDSFYIGLIEIRDSKITGFNNFEISAKLGETKEELLKIFIENRYISDREEKIKCSYILPIKLDDILEDIKIELPKKGAKLELLQLTYKNIYEYAYKKYLNSLSTKGFTKATMKNLLKTLGYNQINKSLIFECNDISHLAGSHTVASRSIIENGKSNTSKYKKFKIKTLESGKIDDFGSMKEIMERRLKEIEKSGIIPDLIIIDGGKGQLNSVIKIIHRFKSEHSNKETLELINNLQVVSIAKREEELFLPGESEPILLDKESLELRLIQKIRDEAHRFAITFNRDKRIKAMKTNLLESLPGFGPITRKKILKTYGSVNKLSGIKKQELEKILNKNQIQTLEDHGII
ncbi:excinuclease ABC subunit UvrC [Candidatus Gracilibacteria bacterium 28_42_T64]|nr:excinuclease ABC subunit UvrC [Candidatus Gracilibacteria bacterium 28_42_T64]